MLSLNFPVFFLAESVISAMPIMGMPEAGIGVKNPGRVLSFLSISLPSARVDLEKGKWLIVGKARGNFQTAASLSLEALKAKGT